MLESYRVIAEYSKNSKYELALKMGDMVDIVEKSPNGEQDVKYGCIKSIFYNLNSKYNGILIVNYIQLVYITIYKEIHTFILM